MIIIVRRLPLVLVVVRSLTISELIRLSVILIVRLFVFLRSVIVRCVYGDRLFCATSGRAQQGVLVYEFVLVGGMKGGCHG